MITLQMGTASYDTMPHSLRAMWRTWDYVRTDGNWACLGNRPWELHEVTPQYPWFFYQDEMAYYAAD